MVTDNMDSSTPVYEGPEIESIKPVVTAPALVTVFLGSFLTLAMVSALTCFCYARTKLKEYWKYRGGRRERPMAFQRRPPTAAIRSQATPSHYLRKSPSPTAALTPTGSGGSSPGSQQPGPLPQSSPGISPTLEEPPQSKPASREQEPPANLHTENEVKDKTLPSPSKEEVESNEKNLVSNNNSPPPGKLGQLIFKLRYKSEKNTLVVSVVKCRDLPAKDPNLGSSDPYVKLQLLPEKQHKVKTRVLRKTRNPVYEEDFTFYGIDDSNLQNITLHFVVLSFDRYSRDDIIGEVFFELSSVNLCYPQNQQMTLSSDILPRSLKIKSQGRGELLVSLCWQPAANRLTVVVLKARNLPKMDVTGLADPYVKMYLLFNGTRIAKKKTHVKKRTLNPVFNESFVFEIPSVEEALGKVSLEFLLLDWDRVTKNEVIGRLELGGSKGNGSALHHWNEVINSPRRQIAEWHKLRG